MKRWILLAIIVAVVAIAIAFFTRKKEKYTQQTMFLDTPKLGPVLRSPNSETMDVLEYSLGGFGGSPQKNC